MTKRAYKRLEQLACYPDMIDMIKRGSTPTEIANYIQEERAEYTDIKRTSLVRVIGDFTRERYAGYVEERKAVRKLDKLIANAHENHDVIRKLCVLASVQEQRLAINIEAELAGGRLIKGTRDEVKTLADLYRLIGDQQDRMNGTREDIKTVHHVVHDANSTNLDKDGKVEGSDAFLSNPSRRQRLFDTLRKAKQASGGADGIEDAQIIDIGDSEG